MGITDDALRDLRPGNTANRGSMTARLPGYKTSLAAGAGVGRVVGSCSYSRSSSPGMDGGTGKGKGRREHGARIYKLRYGHHIDKENDDHEEEPARGESGGSSKLNSDEDGFARPPTRRVKAYGLEDAWPAFRRPQFES